MANQAPKCHDKKAARSVRGLLLSVDLHTISAPTGLRMMLYYELYPQGALMMLCELCQWHEKPSRWDPGLLLGISQNCSSCPHSHSALKTARS